MADSLTGAEAVEPSCFAGILLLLPVLMELRTN